MIRAIALPFIAAVLVLPACRRDAKEAAGAKGGAVKDDTGIRGEQGKNDGEIRKLVATLDEQPDILHGDVTPSVLRLSELGLPAATAVLPFLDADDEMTRARAEGVLHQIVSRRLGWVPGRGYADPHSGQETLRAIWEANGNYDSRSAPEARQRSIALWRRWLTKAATETAP